MNDYLTEDEARDLLRSETERGGGLVRWSRHNGISASYVCNVLQGRQTLGKGIAERLGLERFVGYRRK